MPVHTTTRLRQPWYQLQSMLLNSPLRSGRAAGLVVLLCVLAVLVVYQSPQRGAISGWQRQSTAQLHNATLPEPQTAYQDSPKDAAQNHSTPAHKPQPAFQQDEPRCSAYPDPGNIAIAVKTGATEAIEKIPLLMLTALQCAKNVMIYSDLEQNIAGHQLHDALDNIPKSAMQGNSDFDFYWHLKDAKRLGEVENMLKGAKDPRITNDLAAWTLDKYKQLHILEKLYAAHPDKDWYMMIDADTYIVWPNLLEWLPQLPDPKTHKLYLGSTAVVGDVSFAHGGTGILLSHAAMHDFAGSSRGLASKWDIPMHEECCGDLIIGTELKKLNILLKTAWPSMNGEKPVTLPFGPTQWCEPVVTMHHVMPNEMSQLSNYELSRNETTPLTFADLFDAFTSNIVPETLTHWDNYPNDGQQTLDTYAACRKACEDDQECFQFSHEGNVCLLGHSIHLGEPQPSSAGTMRQSGWLKQRIETWVSNQAPCQPVFPWSQHSSETS